MNEQALADRIGSIVASVLRRRLPADRLPEGATFDDLCIDSFERVYIADEIEREWGAEIADHEIYAWQSLQDVTQTLCGDLP